VHLLSLPLERYSVRVESILFDLDGTLVDTFEGIEYSVRAAVAAVRPEVQLPPLRGFIGPPVPEILRRALPLLGEATVEEIVRRFRVSYDTEGWRRSTPYPGVPETLAALVTQGVRCAVVTNKPALPTRMILAELGLAGSFAAIVSSDSVQPRMSSKAEAVRHVLATLGLNAATTVLVGDSRDDAEAARATGVAFAAAAYGYGRVHERDDAEPIAVLAHFAEVLCLVHDD
jgi:phosphoglycolate phosphatase